MCLLTFIPDYVTPDMDRFKVAAQSNPDGFGFAIHTGRSVIRRHSMDFSQLADQFTDLRTQHQGPATFHFRFATHGSETLDNCHPFLLGGDRETVMAHNGILPVQIAKGDTRSDTRVFAEDYMPNLGGVVSLDDPEYWVKLEAWARGSKLVFLTANPDAKSDWYILNESDGHWDKDMWWSNSSYKRSVYAYPNYGYGSGWGGHYSETTGGWDVRVASDDYDYDDEVDGEWEVIEQQMDVFTTPIDNNNDFVECYHCGSDFVVPAMTISTHCDACSACLFCGGYQCKCWGQLYREIDVDAWNSEVIEAYQPEPRKPNTSKDLCYQLEEAQKLMNKINGYLK
jgi:glutamine amidotransferase